MTGLRAKVRVTGLVQGVGFRFFVERRARELNIGGWVRNTRDGAVEAVFEGPHSAVENMLKLCRQGPPSAGVENVVIQREEFSGEPGGFRAV